MIFLCIVNHNHDEMIINNKDLIDITKDFTVLIKSNTKATDKLKKFSHDYNIQLLDESYSMGFGSNNNYAFNYLKETNQISDSDFFLVINPDVTIKLKQLEKLQEQIVAIPSDIYTINLFKDNQWTIPEQSIKKFPSLIAPIKGLINKNKRNDAYDKSKITQPTLIDWAAGSFLLFTKNSFERLNGFNDKYFMYFEDVDICRRAKIKKMHLMYLPSIKATHIGAFNNRKILSKHFRWYLISYFKYHLFRN